MAQEDMPDPAMVAHVLASIVDLVFEESEKQDASFRDLVDRVRLVVNERDVLRQFPAQMVDISCALGPLLTAADLVIAGGTTMVPDDNGDVPIPLVDIEALGAAIADLQTIRAAWRPR